MTESKRNAIQDALGNALSDDTNNRPTLVESTQTLSRKEPYSPWKLMNGLAASTLPSTSVSLDSSSSYPRGRAQSDAKTQLRDLEKTSSWSDSWRDWLTGNTKEQDRYLNKADRSIEHDKGDLKSKYEIPKNPLVFCHGLLGFDLIGPTNIPALQISHWRGISEVLEENGVEVLITRVPATSSVEDRAKVLDEQIAKYLPGRDINLVAHSMGGLDCRHLATHMNPIRYNIVSITTISTPHQGSSFADYMIDDVIGRHRLPGLLSNLPNRVVPLFSGDGKAFEGLTTKSMTRFNEQTPDLPTIKYFSYAARHDPGMFDTWRYPWSIIVEREGENDGLVSVKSARWGTFMGTIDGANHLDLVGWVNHARFAWAEFTGRAIKYKPATFYMEIADNLAKNGL
ncbi:alpha/beta-hydrolase [Wallemia mellicola]|uniref:GPI inositol-deacylase n=1 Tax=Wallemia mellicola TaxID=1708541 RepID=A0A4T0NXM0_9BASI|nr:alpha/beta-hydrolase [Wallemia mellicola]